MADKTLDTLFHDTLKDVYCAERKILKSLPKMMRAARSPELKAAFEKHIGQTEGEEIMEEYKGTAALLDETLQEESQTDTDLTAIADAAVNADAMKVAA